jgi:type I restriction enzyme S subunit
VQLWSGLMADGRTRTFAELIGQGVLEIGDGYRAKEGEFGDSGPIFLRAARLTEHGLDFADAERFSARLADKVASKLAQPGDTIVTTKGNSVGRTGYVSQNVPAFVYSPHLSYWRSVDHNRLAPGFLRYWAKSPQFLTQLRAMAHSTDMAPYLSLTDQRRLCISVPPISEQNAIAEVLGALDDKIAVNERIAAIADELRALSLRQFVTSYPEATERLSLSSLAQFVNGKAFTKDASGTGRMVIRIAELNSGPGSSTIYNDIEVPPQHLAMPGDVLFAWSGSLRVSRWYRPVAIVNQHIFKVVPRGGIPSWLIFELLCCELPRFRAIAEGKATTMGHIQRHHLDIEVSVPSRQYLARLDAALGLLWRRALHAEQETLTLAELRDMLLPKLISGELRIKDAESVVEEAV